MFVFALALPCTARGDELPSYAIASLGGTVTNTAHTLGCTVGLPLCGIRSSLDHEESVGFWRWFAPQTSEITPPELGVALPAVTRLVASRPNPFHASTRIPFEIAGSAGTPVSVRIEVFDVGGRSVTLLVDDELVPGSYVAEWDARESDAARAAAGVYFARLQAGTTTETLRLVRAR